MFPPKALLDALASQAAQLLHTEKNATTAQFESQLKLLFQAVLSKLDLVTRDEFDSQMLVLSRTRSKLERLEAQVAELECCVAAAQTKD